MSPMMETVNLVSRDRDKSDIIGVSARTNTNQAVQPQNVALCLNLLIYEIS